MPTPTTMLTVARAGASVAGRRWLSAAATAAAAAEHRITTLPNGFRVVTEQVCAVTAGCLLVVLPLLWAEDGVAEGGMSVQR